MFRRFRREFERFKAALPLLLQDQQLRGQWVVFLDGKVMHAAPDRQRAHRWAIEHLDRLAGFVVAEVAETRVYRVGGARRQPA